MDERKKKVLAAIVQDYVNTAEPVGSRTIARKYNLGVSPATIRNEMADLEELGYIEQPHTSAGRVPSDLGYRYFVDFLMERYLLNNQEEEMIRQRFNQRMQEMENVIQRATELLSQITNYTAVVLGPHLYRATFQHIQLLPLAPTRALLVVVTNARVVEHHVLDIPASMTRQDLERVSQVLNSKLRGLALEQVRKDVLREIYRNLDLQRQVLNVVMELLEQSFRSDREEKVYLGGTLNILNQPEFKDVAKLKTLLGVLEEGKLLRELLQDEAGAGLSVRIGGENRYQEISECSLVTATYEIDGQVVGKVGILGPTRMDYPKAMALVEFITQNLSEALAKWVK